MRGFDAGERHAFDVVAAGEEIEREEDALAAGRLIDRGPLAFGPEMCSCGLHPKLIVTAAGREVDKLDRLGRGLA